MGYFSKVCHHCVEKEIIESYDKIGQEYIELQDKEEDEVTEEGFVVIKKEEKDNEELLEVVVIEDKATQTEKQIDEDSSGDNRAQFKSNHWNRECLKSKAKKNRRYRPYPTKY